MTHRPPIKRKHAKLENVGERSTAPLRSGKTLWKCLCDSKGTLTNVVYMVSTKEKNPRPPVLRVSPPSPTLPQQIPQAPSSSPPTRSLSVARYFSRSRRATSKLPIRSEFPNQDISLRQSINPVSRLEQILLSPSSVPPPLSHPSRYGSSTIRLPHLSFVLPTLPHSSTCSNERRPQVFNLEIPLVFLAARLVAANQPRLPLAFLAPRFSFPFRKLSFSTGRTLTYSSTRDSCN